jgi:hypothetical protein
MYRIKNTFKHTGRFIMVSGVLLSLILSGCSEDEATPVNEDADIELSQVNSLTESLIEEDVAFSYIAAETGPTEGGRQSNTHLACANVTHDKDNNIITVDFGDGCIGPFGRERSGKVIITYGGAFNDHMANRVITFENYVVNNRQISGAIELRDLNRTEAGDLSATRKLIDYTVSFPNGESYVANGSITREWIEGEGDNDPFTNVIRVTGSYEGVYSGGRTHRIDIVSPIIADFSCRAQGGFLRTSGIKEIRVEGETVNRLRILNYGDGTCDNSFTVTVNNRTFTITEE